MKNNVLILVIVIIIIALIIVVNYTNTSQNKMVDKKTSLSDLQIEACNSADAAKTCDTRLVDVGIVIKEDCCKELGKCC